MLRTKLLAPVVAAAALGGYAVYNKVPSDGPVTPGAIVSEQQAEAAIQLAQQPELPPVIQSSFQSYSTDQLPST